MNDRLPYEEQLANQWNDLPLPDENLAWDDMKKRLEDDDDGGIIPVWLRGCGLWGLVALVLLAIGWWIIRPEKWWNKKQGTESVATIEQKKDDNDTNNATKINTKDSQQVKSSNEKTLTGKVKNDSTSSTADSSLITGNKKLKSSLQKKNDPVLIEPTDAGSKTKIKVDKQKTVQSIPQKNKPSLNKKPVKNDVDDKVDISIQPANKKKDSANVVEIKNKPTVFIKDSAAVTTIPSDPTDSAAKKFSADSISKKISEPVAKTNEPKKDSSKPKTISFSAGVAMPQLLPIDGQKLTPYSSQGRKSSLADYIPSVFARMYKNDKWFIQLEFRYGAPQYTKNVLYDQQSVLDTAGGTNNTITTSYNLKKTFYHQLPVSFNYFVARNWSIGGGFVWNKFYGAVAERDINKRNNSTQADTILSKTILATKNDTSSVFTKSYFQLLFETQYRWRRFSIGARYSFGLQPYIKFNLNGTSREERNKSLQLFLRYELWKSKAKSLSR